jgi:cytochrome c-type biogenesis protein CcmH/NrfF
VLEGPVASAAYRHSTIKLWIMPGIVFACGILVLKGSTKRET